jgi:hypothetical protein
MSSRTAIRILLTAALALTAAGAAAQDAPRIGISAAPDSYVGELVVGEGEVFTLYACIFGPAGGEPVELQLASVAWVIHQVCCGAEINIHDIQFNPDLIHEGHPLVGVSSTTPTCIDEQGVVLATMQASLANIQTQEMLWAAGPFGPARDCDGGSPLLDALPLTIIYDGVITPDETTSWGAVKAVYR